MDLLSERREQAKAAKRRRDAAALAAATERAQQDERRKVIQGCTRWTMRCPTARNPEVPTAPCCRAHIRRLMEAVGKAFDRHGVRWWIDYGTLLGHLVNGGVYWNDKDADLGVLAEDREKALHVVAPELRYQGFHVTYNQPKAARFHSGDRMKVRLSQRNHTNVDVFFWSVMADGVTLDRQNYISSDRFKGREFPREWAMPTGRALWESGDETAGTPGVYVSVPARPLELIVHRYGEGWQNLPAVRTDGVPR